MEDPCIGIDEAGRGAFAGPFVAASVYIPDAQGMKEKLGSLPIRDSKTLSERQRERVFEAMCEFGISFETISISVPEINRRGIGWANTSGIRTLIKRAFSPQVMWSCSTLPVEVIVDGYFPQKKIAVKDIPVRCQVDADATVFSVILAGIVAKVTRDRIMKTLHEEYAMYGWERNKGYGTREHIEAIKRCGMCPYHREQFVKTALDHVIPAKAWIHLH